MARIAGVDIPKQKRGIIALTYIFGIGRSRAKDILAKAQVSEDKKVQDWNDDEIGAIREAVSYFKIEGELRSEVDPEADQRSGTQDRCQRAGQPGRDPDPDAELYQEPQRHAGWPCDPVRQVYLRPQPGAADLFYDAGQPAHPPPGAGLRAGRCAAGEGLPVRPLHRPHGPQQPCQPEAEHLCLRARDRADRHHLQHLRQSGQRKRCHGRFYGDEVI